MIIWPYPAGVQKVVIELKILYGSLEMTIKKGLQQTWDYMSRSGSDKGHLVVFDRNSGKSWEEKIFCQEEEYRDRRIKVWGM